MLTQAKFGSLDDLCAFWVGNREQHDIRDLPVDLVKTLSEKEILGWRPDLLAYDLPPAFCLVANKIACVIALNARNKKLKTEGKAIPDWHLVLADQPCKDTAVKELPPIEIVAWSVVNRRQFGVPFVSRWLLGGALELALLAFGLEGATQPSTITILPATFAVAYHKDCIWCDS